MHSLVSLLALFLVMSLVPPAGEIVVPLKFTEEPQFAMFSIDLGEALTGAREGLAPGGVPIRVQPLEGQGHAYQVIVGQQPARTLSPEASLDVRIERQWGPGNRRELPYAIRYHRSGTPEGKILELFYWQPLYRTVGTLQFKDCRALLVVLDFNGDGIFDEKDFGQGTSIGLDRNGDARIWGQEEWLKARQPIEFCGSVLQIERVAADGSSITLAESNLRVPALGEPLPALSLIDQTGAPLDPQTWKGRILLLDFWASWCQPCVAQFPNVKRLAAEFKDEVVIVSVNVDERDRLAKARDAIQHHQLSWPVVMNGLGELDPLWRTLGSMGNNRLGIPLYVLVDQKGMLCYASGGGKELAELRGKIQALLQNK